MRSHERFRWRDILKVPAALATLAVALANAGCTASEQPEKPTATVTVTVAPPDNYIDLSQPVTILPYRIVDESNPPAKGEGISNEQLNKNMTNAAKYMTYDFGGKITISMQPSVNQSMQPEGKEQTGQLCYTAHQLGKLVEQINNDKQRANSIPAIVLNTTDQCETVNDNGTPREVPDGAAANATAGRTLFKAGPNGESYAVPSIIAHEAGHVLGLHHVGKLTCKRPNEAYDATNPALQDIAKIVEGYDCGIVQGQAPTTGEGVMASVNQYAGSGSVMGNNSRWNDTGIVPLFSTYDHAQVLPEVYKIETIQPNAEQEYTLKYGADELVGVRIRLPADHPLTVGYGDAGFDELIATVEVTGGSVTAGEEYTKPRTCGENSFCETHLYAVNSETGFRVELPETFGWVAGDTNGSERKVLYMDESLGIGLVQEKVYPAKTVTLRVVSYEEVVVLAHEQYAQRKALLDQYAKEADS